MQKYYYNLFTDGAEDAFDKDILDEIESYLEIKKTHPEFEFVVLLNQKKLFKEETRVICDKIISQLKTAGVDVGSIVFSVVKDNTRFSSKQWRVVRAWNDYFTEKQIKFGFEDFNKTWMLSEVECANLKVNETVDVIKQSRCSPYEALLMCYLTVTSREFVEESEDAHWSISRSIYGTMNNDEIVCTGFAGYLRAIIEKVGFDNIKLYTNIVEVSSDNEISDGLHENLIVYIKDEKYGIEGYYYLDPTWDCKAGNENPSLNFFLVPVEDIKTIKSHIRKLGFCDVPNGVGDEAHYEDLVDDIIYGGISEPEENFTADSFIMSQQFLADFIKLHPQIMDKLLEEYKSQMFKLDYTKMENFETALQTEQDVLNMLVYSDVDKIGLAQLMKLRALIGKHEEGVASQQDVIDCVQEIINQHYEKMGQGSSFEKLPNIYSTQQLIRQFMGRLEERLVTAQSAKAQIFTSEDIYHEILTDNQGLLDIIIEEIKNNSEPIHIGKTTEALRRSLTILYPEIMPKLIDKKVRETIEFNMQQSKKCFTRKAKNAFIELSKMQEYER